MPARKPHPDAEYVAEMVQRLGRFDPAVSARAMFGGHGLFVDGSMFALVDDRTLYLKAADENRPAFEAAGMQPWTIEMRGRLTGMSYYPIPEDDLEDPQALRRWFEGARAAAARAAAAAKQGKTAKPKKR